MATAAWKPKEIPPSVLRRLQVRSQQRTAAFSDGSRVQDSTTVNVENIDTRCLFGPGGNHGCSSSTPLVSEAEEMMMESIREHLFDVLHNEYPTGVVSTHLEKVYKERYPEGPPLTDDWASKLTDEFEVQKAGPLTMIYARRREQAVHFRHPVGYHQPPSAAAHATTAASSVLSTTISAPVLVEEITFAPDSTSFIEEHRQDMQNEACRWDQNAKYAAMNAVELMHEMQYVPLVFGPNAPLYTAIVTSSYSADEFHVRLKDSAKTCVQLQSAMRDNYGDAVTDPEGHVPLTDMGASSVEKGLLLPIPVEHICVGGLYAAYRSNPQSLDWHRVCVMNLSVSNRMVNAYFIDHGDIEVLPADHLRRILPDLVNPSSAAVGVIKCSLVDADMSAEQLQSSAVESAFDFHVYSNAASTAGKDTEMTEKQILVRFVARMNPNLAMTAHLPCYHVQLYSMETDECINDMVRLIVRREMAEAQPMPATPVPTRNAGDDSGSSGASFVTAHNGNSSISMYENAVVTQPALVPFDGLPAEQESAQVEVLFAPDPADFTVMLCAIHPIPAYTSAAVQRESELQPSLLDSGTPVIMGHFYAAKVVVDRDGTEEWQRVYASGSAQQESFHKVFLVDKGYFSAVHIRNMRPLTPAATASSQMVAIKCQLANVCPTSSDSKAPWPADARRAFAELCAAEKIFLARRESGAVGVWRHEHAPGLPLMRVHLRTVDGRDVGDWLVQQGLAVRRAATDASEISLKQ